MDKEEFETAFGALGYPLTKEAVEKEFESMDKVGGDVHIFHSATVCSESRGPSLTCSYSQTHLHTPLSPQNDSGNVRYPEFCYYMAKIVSPMQLDLE